MRRRLLLSYLTLTAVVLLLLEVPLGLLEARQENDALAATARRDATALTVLVNDADNSNPGELAKLASRYRQQAGSELAIMNSAGKIIVSLDRDERDGRSNELAPMMRSAMASGPVNVRRDDEGVPYLVSILPVRSGTRIAGVVAVAVPAASTDRRIRRAWMGLVALALLLMGIAAGLGVLLARSVTAPVTTLQDAAERLGGGDLDARAPPGGPREIASLSSEFNRMADQLAALVERQRRFVADASHQLRTPLTSLRLRLENLIEAPGADSLADEIGDCQAEVDRLGRLVDGLLALGRAEAKPRPATTADVGAVTGDRAQSWAALAEERDVHVTVEGQPESPLLVAIDPDELEQVLDNLLANAVEASPAHATISITIEEVPGWVVLHVRDQGPGMSAEDRARAFDRFWQGANGATGSSGLGLPIVRELVARAGGTVTLGSADGGGLDAMVRLNPV